MSKMLDFRAVIQEFGDKAVEDYCGWMEKDEKALTALANSDVKAVIDWLHYYRVFQGLTSTERIDISTEIVKWASDRRLDRDLGSTWMLTAAHEKMTEVCVKGLGRERDFTSLASKALWLCYPQQVPIFDSIASCALCVLSHLEEDIDPIPKGVSRYGKFAHTWKHFFETYADSIKEIDTQSCRYPVRVFDAILLRVGDHSSEA